MPKVLRIINRFNLGGPTYNVAYLSKYMAPEFETLLIGGKFGESEGSSDFIIKKLGLHPIIIPEMQREINARNDYIAYQKIKQIIKRFQPDIVHTHASKAGFLGRKAASSLNVPVIVHTFHGHVFHSYFNKYKTLFYKGIERNLAKNSSKIIAISDIQKHELCNIHKIANESKIRVIPLGFDLERFQDNYAEKRVSFRAKYKLQDDVLAIGIVGRLVHVKNHRMFIDSIAKIKASTNKKIRVFIIGDGELKTELIAQAQYLGLQTCDAKLNGQIPDIIFTSWIHDIDWAYAGLDLACLTSLNEGTPVSLIEAQAGRAPIVSTNVGGIENVVIPNKTALLALNNNTDDFTLKLSEIIQNDKMRESMQQEGWNFVSQRFHYNRLVSDMKNLYNELLAE
ncbi:MAG: glycosyltransferase [Bacteroidales bacterium]|jgi:glycosyltransferase involved in cell wall biosynthesis|nr:glycosyltransferase [Bacteroidales bacterium]